MRKNEKLAHITVVVLAKSSLQDRDKGRVVTVRLAKSSGVVTVEK
jgi:hypothetical protein